MSPVYIKPESIERHRCPLCKFLQAIRVGEVYQCLGNDNRGLFYGTKADAERILREREIETRLHDVSV